MVYDETDWILKAWGDTLDALESDSSALVGTLDWVTKKYLLDCFCEAEGLAWENPDDVSWMQAQDLEYHNVDRKSGLYYLLEAEGQTVRLVGDDEVSEAMAEPPPHTRAYFRGRSLEKFGDRVKSINWDRIVFAVNGQHQAVDLKGMVEDDLVRQCNRILDRSDTVEELLQELQAAEVQPALVV